MNDNYTPWYRYFRFSVWAIHVLTGALAFIGLLGLLFLLTLVPDLGWMVWFLPAWFCVCFIFFFIGNIIRYKHWDRLPDGER